MRIPDVNVLLNAGDTSSPQHEPALAWMERALSQSEAVGFAVVSLLGFVRIATNPRISPNPSSVAAAMDQVEEWLGQPCATLVQPGSRHLGILRELLESAGTAGNLTTDAHLAALAIENGATLATFDGDFHRFAELKLDYLG